MILGNEAIFREHKTGNIVIEPYTEDQLQGNSYDVRLDKIFLVPNTLSNESFKDLTFQNDYNYNYVLDELILQSNHRCLARTIEQIGSNCNHIVPMIASKSSWARSGLEVCSCAGFGDCGYHDHWTLEIFNKNPYSVRLEKGLIIAQVYFQYVEGCTKMYKSKYNDLNNSNIEKMLPKPIRKVV